MRRLFLVLVSAAAFCAGAWAGNVATVDVQVTGSLGAFTYSYTLTASGPDGLGGFSLQGWIDMGVVPGSTQGPTGWTILENSNLVTWLSTDAAYDILPGNSLGGFSFQSPNAPSSIQASLIFYNEDAGTVSEVTSPRVTGPDSPAPEPESWLVVGAGVLAGMARRGAKRR